MRKALASPEDADRQRRHPPARVPSQPPRCPDTGPVHRVQVVWARGRVLIDQVAGAIRCCTQSVTMTCWASVWSPEASPTQAGASYSSGPTPPPT